MPPRLLALSLLATFALNSAERTLTLPEARTLVANIPDVLAAKRKRGCPKVETLAPLTEKEALFQIRNACASGGAGLIGNYVVDRRTGEVWSDIDRRHSVLSERLEALRRRMLK